eukprot:GHVL01008814.1.p1 GENE.GHVL01008814.1~~GHVL01008814.1.p1  ORF type:complete len:313 (+),score=40.29 GHVL01008814.1:19-957(+)
MKYLEEIIYNILLFFPIKERSLCISKEWRCLSLQNALWRDVNLEDESLQFPFFLNFLKKFGNYIQILNLSGAVMSDWKEGYICDMLLSCPNLHTVNLSFLTFLDEKLTTQTLATLSYLKNLNLDGCSWLTDKGLSNIRCDTVTSLSLAYCEQLRGAYLTKFILLQELNIDGCYHIDPYFINTLMATKRLIGIPLRRLHLDGELVDSITANHICKNCISLEEFHVSFAHNFNYHSLLPLDCSNMASFCLKKAHLLNAEEFTVLINQLAESKCLKFLCLAECPGLTDSTPLEILAFNLIHLDLSWSWNLSDVKL